MDLNDIFEQGSNISGDIVAKPKDNLAFTISPQEVLQLAPFVAEASDFAYVNETTAAQKLSTLSSGLIKSGSLLASANYSLIQSKTVLKQKQAVAALEKFPGYCAERGIKATEAQREAFVDQCSEVIEAAQQVAYFEALVKHLDTIKMSMIMAISSVKSIVYGHKDSNSVTGNVI
jgi:hypothetical protein